MLLSGVTHVSQLFVYGFKHHVIGAAVFGAIYFLIGLALLGRTKIALWIGIVLPSIGGILGVYRFLVLQVNSFSIFHIIIDLIVVPVCIYLLTKSGGEKLDS